MHLFVKYFILDLLRIFSKKISVKCSYTVFLCLCIGLLNIADADSASCIDTAQSSDQGVQREIINQLCRHSVSLAKRFNSSKPQVVLLQQERWQQLPDCPAALNIRFSAMVQNGKLPLMVSCPDNGSIAWKQRLAARMDFDVSVLLAVRNINRGESLSDLKMSGLKTSKVRFSAMKPNAFQHTDNLSGYVATRKITTGSVITADMVKKVNAIRRGQPLTIVAQSKTVVLSTTGVAMESGHVGDIILVQKENGRSIKCRVMNEGEVRPVEGSASR